ncbi:MAG: hypothetical protein KDK91_29710 [Gammaproteobacteria bacterium]|nr:hypothetical protein [Gammaproteobacteria bacterium]
MPTIACQTCSRDYLHLDDNAPVPAEGDVTVPLDAWRRHTESLSWREGRTGVRIEAGLNALGDIPNLSRLAAVVVESGTSQPCLSRLMEEAGRLRESGRFNGTLLVRPTPQR